MIHRICKEIIHWFLRQNTIFADIKYARIVVFNVWSLDFIETYSKCKLLGPNPELLNQTMSGTALQMILKHAQVLNPLG